MIQNDLTATIKKRKNKKMSKNPSYKKSVCKTIGCNEKKKNVVNERRNDVYFVRISLFELIAGLNLWSNKPNRAPFSCAHTLFLCLPVYVCVCVYRICLATLNSFITWTFGANYTNIHAWNEFIQNEWREKKNYRTQSIPTQQVNENSYFFFFETQ